MNIIGIAEFVDGGEQPKEYRHAICVDPKTMRVSKIEIPINTPLDAERVCSAVAKKMNLHIKEIKIPRRIAATLAARLRETSQPKGEKET